MEDSYKSEEKNYSASSLVHSGENGKSWRKNATDYEEQIRNEAYQSFITIGLICITYQSIQT